MVVYLVEFSNPNRPDIPPRRKPGCAKCLPDNIISYRYGGKWKEDYKDLHVKLLAYRQINRPSAHQAWNEVYELEQKALDKMGRKAPGRPLVGYEGPIDNIEEYFDIEPIKGSGGFTEMLHLSRTDREADINDFLEIVGEEGVRVDKQKELF